MSDLADKKTPTEVPLTPDVAPKIPEAPASKSNGKAGPDNLLKSPSQILQAFLDEQKLELRLTPPQVRNLSDGGLVIDPPLIVVNFKGATGAVPTPAVDKN